MQRRRNTEFTIFPPNLCTYALDIRSMLRENSPEGAGESTSDVFQIRPTQACKMDYSRLNIVFSIGAFN